ncbi:glycine-rich domain-containing 2-like [Brachionus plicatilis]|uniref:Glycine-rich domain-containing 2-like n=1 Tax=Brachionus plicatilis TaxID=10195 RepID=A0A3M7QEC1_BRAPC|nr:glycine-rich domain-containing 2-like [Brachionus plicatilis]
MNFFPFQVVPGRIFRGYRYIWALSIIHLLKADNKIYILFDKNNSYTRKIVNKKERKHKNIDLLESTRNQIEYIEYIINNEKSILSEQLIAKAIYRYEKVWLPLCQLVDSKKKQLSDYYPPHDVAWVWRSHMLSPNEYRNDLTKEYGQVFDHSCFSLSEIFDKQAITEIEWLEFSGFSFDYFDILSVDQIYRTFKSSFSANLKELCGIAKEFAYDQNYSIFNEELTKSGIKEYEKFLNFRSTNSHAFFVPDFALDLVWHSHLLHPGAYFHDCELLFGRLMHHNCIQIKDETLREIWYSFISIITNFSIKSSELKKLDQNNFSLNCNIEYIGIFEVEEMSIKSTNDEEASFETSIVNENQQLMLKNKSITNQEIDFRKSDSCFYLSVEKNEQQGKENLSSAKVLIEIKPFKAKIDLFIPEERLSNDKTFTFECGKKEYLASIRYSLSPNQKVNVIRFGFEKNLFRPGNLKNICKQLKVLSAKHLVTVGNDRTVFIEAEIIHLPRIYRSAIIISKNNIPIALSLSSYPRTDPNQPEVELGKNMTVVNKSLKFDLPNNNTDARVDMKNGEIEVEVKENQTTFSDVIDILINALAITMQYVMFMPKPLLIYNETEKRLEEKMTDEMPVSIRNSKLLDLMGFNDLLDLNVLFNLDENNLSICSCINNRRWFNFSSQIMEDDQTSIGFKTKYENNF